MTERVTIEGRDLAVTTDTAPDPKRRRPPEYQQPTGDGRAKSTGRSLEEIVHQPNPYWDDDGQRIMQQDEPYAGSDDG